jgi:hypothetical protein
MRNAPTKIQADILMEVINRELDQSREMLSNPINNGLTSHDVWKIAAHSMNLCLIAEQVCDEDGVIEAWGNEWTVGRLIDISNSLVG